MAAKVAIPHENTKDLGWGQRKKRGCQVVVGLAGKDARRMEGDLRVAKTSRIRFTTTRQFKFAKTVAMFFTHTLYNDAARRIATVFE